MLTLFRGFLFYATQVFVSLKKTKLKQIKTTITTTTHQKIQSQLLTQLMQLRGSSLHLFLHSAVQLYEFHIFIVTSSSFPGILPTNLMTSSQLAC